MLCRPQFLLGVFAILFPIHVSAQIYDWEDFNKTVVGIERISERKEMSFLNSLSDDEFIHSKQFALLFETIKKNNLNLGYAQVRCVKEFELKDSRTPYAPPQRLLISFMRGDNYSWYVEYAYLQEGKDTVKFETKGFKPLSIEYNFSDFVTALKTGEIREFSGIAPFGNLPVTFFASKKVQKTPAATIIVTNMIFHAEDDSLKARNDYVLEFDSIAKRLDTIYYDNRKITEVGYIILKNTSKLEGRKRGWLINEFGFMNDFYTKYMQRDVFHDFVLEKVEGGKKKRLDFYDLDKPSKFYFENLRSVRDD